MKKDEREKMKTRRKRWK